MINRMAFKNVPFPAFFSAFLSGQTLHSRNRPMRLLVLMHNRMILLVAEEVCDGADLSRLLPP